MEPKRLIIGGGLKEMARLLNIMSRKSIMDMEPNSEYKAGIQQVEEVPLREVRGRITSFIGCLEHQGECAACPGCWEYYGDLDYQESCFELQEEVDFLDFDSQFEEVELHHRREAADRLAKNFLGKDGIVGIYGATDGHIKVFIRGNMELIRNKLPAEYEGHPLEIIQSPSFATKEISITAPVGPIEAFND